MSYGSLLRCFLKKSLGLLLFKDIAEATQAEQSKITNPYSIRVGVCDLCVQIKSGDTRAFC